MQHSDTAPQACSTKGKQKVKSDFIKIKSSARFETKKYAKINYPLAEFAGIFYWEKVGQGLR